MRWPVGYLVHEQVGCGEPSGREPRTDRAQVDHDQLRARRPRQNTTEETLVAEEVEIFAYTTEQVFRCQSEKLDGDQCSRHVSRKSIAKGQTKLCPSHEHIPDPESEEARAFRRRRHEIYLLFLEGKSKAELSRLHGISVARVSQILMKAEREAMARAKKSGYEVIPPEFEISDGLKAYLQSQVDAAYEKGFQEGKEVNHEKQLKKAMDKQRQEFRKAVDEAMVDVVGGLGRIGVDLYDYA